MFTNLFRLLEELCGWCLAQVSHSFSSSTAAVILLISAGLKGGQFIHSSVLSSGWRGLPNSEPVLIGWEIFLGLWLLSGALPLAARRTATGCFALFGGYAFWEALAGKASCGCFGQVHGNMNGLRPRRRGSNFPMAE